MKVLNGKISNPVKQTLALMDREVLGRNYISDFLFLLSGGSAVAETPRFSPASANHFDVITGWDVENH